ncbi:MAG: dihydroorotase [Chloroflexi bacterium]|nr:dihydroorotase [Chloroflexota bacterium]
MLDNHLLWLIKGGRVLDPSQGLDQVGNILVKDGKVAWIKKHGAATSPPDNCHTLDAKGLIVCPGFIDLHCHLREPGYEDKETIATGTMAAARGGFTTVCAMPNTNPPLDNGPTVEFVKRKAQEEGVVRVIPVGCITKGRLGNQMAEMAELARAGVVGFSDDGSPLADSNIMRSALSYSRSLGLPIINHCEDPDLFRGGAMNEGWVSTRLGLKGIPTTAEATMASRDIALAELTGGRLHLAHISTAASLERVRQAKEKGIRVTCEVTPHHLTMSEDWVLGNRGEGSPFPPLGAGAYNTMAKVNPPLRSREDVQAMIQGLREGIIDAIATDHAPHSHVDKLCTFDEAAFGISVLETALGSLMTLVHGGSLPLPTLIARLTWAPAQLIGSDLGTLKDGSPADITILDPDAPWVVDTSQFASKGKNTPLEGATLKGKVMATMVAGTFRYRDDKLKMEQADG